VGQSKILSWVPKGGPNVVYRALVEEAELHPKSKQLHREEDKES
jgi:hypothetical protein